MDLVKRMQVEENMENLWIMFDHVKYLKDWTTFACYVYDSKCCKMLTIACYDMQFKDGVTQMLFWKKLNFVMLENGVSIVNFKVFMANNSHANWNTVRKIHGVGDPSLPMVGRERTCFFHWSQSLDKVMKKYIMTSLQLQYK